MHETHTLTWYTHIQLQIQLEKLACNALSNPICALEDAVTAYILSIPETNMRLMQEISSVVLALPEAGKIRDDGVEC